MDGCEGISPLDFSVVFTEVRDHVGGRRDHGKMAGSQEGHLVSPHEGSVALIVLQSIPLQDRHSFPSFHSVNKSLNHAYFHATSENKKQKKMSKKTNKKLRRSKQLGQATRNKKFHVLRQQHPLSADNETICFYQIYAEFFQDLSRTNNKDLYIESNSIILP